MMRRLRNLTTGRSARGSSSLGNDDRGGARNDPPRRGGRAAPSLPSSQQRRGRTRTGLPLSSKKVESPPDAEAEKKELATAETPGSDPSETSQQAEQDNSEPDADESTIQDEDDSNEQDVDQEEEEQEHRRSRSSGSESLLQAIVHGELVSVTVAVGAEGVEDNSPQSSLSSTRARTRRGLDAVRDQASEVVVSSSTHGTRSSSVRSVSQTRTVLGNDGNQFYCHVCKDFGDVVCCDGCPRVYHPTCIPVEDPSRQSLDKDHDPWFCPDCITKKERGVSSTSRRSRSGSYERRMPKRKCNECQESGGDTPMEPCEKCGVYLHHPSCDGEDLNGDAASVVPLCSNCRAEAVVAGEETERVENPRKRRKMSQDESQDRTDDDGTEDDDSSRTASEDRSLRKRSRSIDTISDDEQDSSEDDHDHGEEEQDEEDMREEDESEDKSGDPTTGESAGKRKRGRPRLTMQQKKERAAEKAELARVTRKLKRKQNKRKKKRKKKKRRHDKEAKASKHNSPRSSPANGEVTPMSPSLRTRRGLVRATPAFFYFLSDNRLKIERVLSRKKPIFNRLPKGLERTEMIAKEGAVWWIKARQNEQQRYMNMSMRDFEEQVVAWKEEKNIKEMMESEGQEVGPDGELVSPDDDDSTLPEDNLVTYNNHQRLYVATSVGSKPFTPEPGHSNNRVLLELLQDMRFHPIPMFNPNGTEAEAGQLSYPKMTIPHFDVHGPVSTSIGDECLGCSRGWNHFCSVMQRRLPAVEHRARLQPPLSSLLATRVGLGLQQDPIDTKKGGDILFSQQDAEVFSVRETHEATIAKSLPQVQSYFLSQPSTRADDIVQFVEEAVAMKAPEPQPPRTPTLLSETSRKSNLARGALPTRERKKSSFGSSGSDGGALIMKKCGRCRTIIETDTGCVQCRRAQLVINMSKKQPSSSKRDGAAASRTGGFLTVQTTMVGRLNVKENNFDKQTEGDRAVSNAITSMRWAPTSVLPPVRLRVPRPNSSKVIETVLSSDEEVNADSDVAEGNVDLSDSEGVREKQEGGERDESHNEPVVNEEGSHESGESISSTKEEDEEEEKQPSRSLPGRSTRLRASTRLGSAESTNSTGARDMWDPADRQALAKAHQEEASEIHKRCIGIASSGILLAMMRRDPLWLFAEPVPASIVDYSLIVKEPIDFSKIRRKVLDRKYSSFGSFISDARLLCTNALAYNLPGSIYSKTAKELYDVLEVMQKRATEWIGAIRDAHASSFAWKGAGSGRFDDMDNSSTQHDPKHDPFKELRKSWPEAVEMYENGDWARRQIDADFMRTRENEFAYYGSLAIRRAAVAAESSLAQYPDQGGIHNVVVRRNHLDDEGLRRHVDKRVSKLGNPVQLKDMPTWREEAIIRVLRRVQSRNVEGRIASENGCAKCDPISIEPETKMAMRAEALRWGRNKKKGELDTLPRIDKSRLSLSTGLASASTRKRVEERDVKEEKSVEVGDISVSVRGSDIHGWGLFADQPFKSGDIVAEYIGEYIGNPVADAREKMYQEQRIQEYKFRVDENLVIDATLRGGHGRYINHNCNPNCIAKKVKGEAPNQHLKRVLIISQRDIRELEEITYDYQFPLELDLEERKPCNCGSIECRGFLNWDLPEKGSKNRVTRTQKRGGNMRDRIRRLERPLKK